ncbi:MAG: hypothetical protein KAJ49_09320 [Arcobacteraceae bacterium]|nr:hypothetical protein [Arcobacteraceae bacterium]
MKNIFFLFIICISLFSANLEKHLSSQMRAEVYVQNLIEGGYYKKSQEFLDLALKKYQSSEALYIFSASTAYNLKDFDKAKVYIIKTLEINPMNEEATRYKQMIELQEEAKENKVLSDLFEYLSDKGLDFLSIFLAFLGGEIIARRYAKCNSIEIINIAKQYKDRILLDTSIFYKIKFALQNSYSFKNMFSFCTFLNILVLFIVSSSLLIFWLFIELTLSLDLFLEKSFMLMSSSEIWQYSVNTFLVFTIITILIQLILYIGYLEQNPLKVELKLSEHLDSLVEQNNIIQLYELLEEFKVLSISKDELLFDTLTDETKEKITYIYQL